jgi:uncharacterized membrane protein
MKYLKETYWHRLFEVGVFFKALNSVWETIGGLFLLTAVGRNWFTYLFVHFSNSVLLGDHDDLLFQLVHQHLMNIAGGTHLFVGVYLLFHGLMNAFLAYNLFRNRLWAYPVSITFVSLFFVYQVYRLFHTHSIILLLVTIFDIFFIVLTWHEYRYQTQKQHVTLAS